MSYWGFPKYVSVAEKKAKAAKKLKELSKKKPDMKPVALKGSALAHTWWGKAWNSNLEQYADYSNRIGRGRSYVRHGAVLDLQIEPGKVIALVQGSDRNPYCVSVKIQTLKKETWQRMKTACEGTLESFQELLAGNFPKALGEIFICKDSGMFPAPIEIKFDCSCPDWADMCKHVAAVLYGVGVRLDEDPKLFFRLRDAGIDELIKQAVAGKVEKLLEKAGRKSGRIIEDKDIASVFGIDIEEQPAIVKNKTAKAVAGRKKSKPAKTSAGRKVSAKKGLQASKRVKKVGKKTV
ncbi:MAG: SWIM zinc finger family protein [Nitrospirae bacterium]|nr:SWIM zinc finger family protein [Nitrospirota bacterium]